MKSLLDCIHILEQYNKYVTKYHVDIKNAKSLNHNLTILQARQIRKEALALIAEIKKQKGNSYVNMSVEQAYAEQIKDKSGELVNNLKKHKDGWDN